MWAGVIQQAAESTAHRGLIISWHIKVALEQRLLKVKLASPLPRDPISDAAPSHAKEKREDLLGTLRTKVDL